MTEPVYDQQDADNYHLATENRNLRKALEELQQQITALRAENEQAQQREEAWEANCNTAWQTVDDMTARAEAAGCCGTGTADPVEPSGRRGPHGSDPRCNPHERRARREVEERPAVARVHVHRTTESRLALQRNPDAGESPLADRRTGARLGHR